MKHTRKALAILLLLLLLPTLFSCGRAEDTSKMQTIIYKIYLPNLDATLARGIVVGDSVRDGASKGDIGRIVACQREDAYTEYMQDGILTLIPVPDRTDVFITVRHTAPMRKEQVYVGTLPLRCGRSLSLHMPHYCGEGVVVEVLR